MFQTHANLDQLQVVETQATLDSGRALNTRANRTLGTWSVGLDRALARPRGCNPIACCSAATFSTQRAQQLLANHFSCLREAGSIRDVSHCHVVCVRSPYHAPHRTCCVRMTNRSDVSVLHVPPKSAYSARLPCGA